MGRVSFDGIFLSEESRPFLFKKFAAWQQLLELQGVFKIAAELGAAILTSSFFKNSFIHCHFSLRCEMTFLTVRKLTLSSLLKIKERSKFASKCRRKL